jgi:hypothetical protein
MDANFKAGRRRRDFGGQRPNFAELRELALVFSAGAVSRTSFERALRELEREKLWPRGVAVRLHDVSRRRIRLIVKERRDGTVLDEMEVVHRRGAELQTFNAASLLAGPP